MPSWRDGPSSATTSADLPNKPADSQQPSKTSLRRQAAAASRRVRSPSPVPGPSHSTQNPSTPAPLPKKPRTDGPASLLSRIAASDDFATPGSSTTGTSAVKAGAGSSTPGAGETPRAQFEQQEDFISFDASPPPPPSTGRNRRLQKRERDVTDVDGTNRMKDRESGRSTPWCDRPGVDWNACKNPTQMLNREAHAYIDYISPTPAEHELRLLTIELVRRTIKARWRDAQVECFGSVGTGLYLPGGDIDLVLISSSMPAPPLKPSPSLLHQIAALLLHSGLAVPSSLIVIAKARVPIVKFVTRWGGFSVDMSVNQHNGVDAAVRVRRMLEEHAFRPSSYREPGEDGDGGQGAVGAGAVGPPQGEGADHGVARSLVLLVKTFLAQRGMNEVFTGGLGSYAIICLVISFLQLHPKIQSGEIHPYYNLGLLFVEFCELYGRHFNYDQAGISLRGRGGYFNKHDKGWYKPNTPYHLSIEDPNDTSNDVSAGSHNIRAVRQTFGGAFESLTATLAHRSSCFAAAATNNQTSPLNGAYLPNADSRSDADPLSQSILGAVVGMSAAGLQAREENVSLYEAGILQRMIGNSAPLEAAGGKRQKQRERKEAVEKEKQAKTAAKLERKRVEKEEKQQRKEEKRRRLEEGLAPKRVAADAAPAEVLEEGIDKGLVEVVKPGEAAGDTFEGNADFVDLGFSSEEDDEEEDDEDHVARTLFPGGAADSDEEEDSRYSASTTNKQQKRKQRGPSRSPAPPALQNVVYTVTDSSDSAMDEAESDDEDVVIGGTGGSMVRSRSTSQAPVQQATSIKGKAKANGKPAPSRTNSTSSIGSGAVAGNLLRPEAATRSPKKLSVKGAARGGSKEPSPAPPSKEPSPAESASSADKGAAQLAKEAATKEAAQRVREGVEARKRKLLGADKGKEERDRVKAAFWKGKGGTRSGSAGADGRGNGAGGEAEVEMVELSD